MNLNNFKLDGRTIVIGILIIAGIFLLGRQLLGGNSGNTTAPVLDENAPQNADIEIGRMVSASGIDAAGCPVNTTTTFSPSDAIYVVAQDSDVAAGTDIFARLFQEGAPVEDSVLITADQDYIDTCIYLEFEATSGAEILESWGLRSAVDRQWQSRSFGGISGTLRRYSDGLRS